MAVILNLDWELYAEGKSCQNYGNYKGRLNSVDSCGSICKGVASMFMLTHGYGKSMKCWCVRGATGQGTCTTITNHGYDLFRYISGDYVT